MFKRKIYNQMLVWKQESSGKNALLIEGARRVGKSTVTKAFAEKEYQSYILIDFSTASKAVKDLFEDLSDLNFFFLQLQLLFQTTLHKRESVIIFDEVQLFPLARQAIKTLVSDGRYDYIETGSLISIRKNVKDILIPSEEKRLNMVPMDYEEFRWALGDTATVPLLKQAFQEQRSIGDVVHRRLMRDFRLYMLVGGMPQAVESYLETNNLQQVDAIKRDILNLYEADFRKIDATGRMSLLFDAIPAELNRNTSRYQVSSILPNVRAGTVESLFAEMKDSKTVLAAYHANDPNIGLASHHDITRFKLYLADTGLFTTLQFKDKAFTDNIIYEKLLSNKLSANLGYLYENVIAQTLTASGHQLFYYTWKKTPTAKPYEMDFLIAKNNKIIPIEVKSSGYLRHASLDAFSLKYSNRIDNRYLVYTKDLRKDKDIICLPVYMTQFL